MDYLKIYNSIIEKRKNIPLDVLEYGENHHIVPRCMGGSDDKSNIIRLSSREHFIVHHLLWKHYRTPQLAHAWFMMLRCDKNQKRIYTSRQHESALKAHKEAMKQTMTGDGNHFFGKKHTQNTKDKISKANSGKKRTDEFKSNVSKKFKGISKTPDHREKIGRKGMIMLKNIHTNENIRIYKSDKILYDDNIWKNPYSVSHEQSTQIYCCEYCNFETKSKLNILRWHNENCKYKDTGIYIDTSQNRKTDKRIIPITINGKTYKSLRQAQLDLNLTKAQIKKIYNETKID